MTLEFGSDVRSPGPNLTKFPVLFPDSRETVFGDGFARDCLLSQPVRVSRYSPVESLKPGRFPGLSGLKPNQRRVPGGAVPARTGVRSPFKNRRFGLGRDLG